NSNELLYSVRHTNIADESKKTEYFIIDANNQKQAATQILKDKSFVQWDNNGLYAKDKQGVLWLSKDRGITWLSVAKGLQDAEVITVSPNGQYIAFSKHILMKPVNGVDKYNDVAKSTAQIYDDLNFRHWDTWFDGKISHVF